MFLSSRCAKCQKPLFKSNKFCPYCSHPNQSAIPRATDLEQQMVLDGLEGTEKLAWDFICTPELHQKIAQNLKHLAVADATMAMHIKAMKFCSECGNPLPT